MGVILFIDLEREVPNLKDNLGGKAWARVDLELNELAEHLGLTPIESLTSCSQEQFAELMGDSPHVDVTDYEEEWFDAAEGLQTVKGLFEHVMGRKDLLDRWEFPEYILEDMQEAMKILRAAVAAGVRFHFSCAF
jgi:hypothetical protein